MGDEKRESYITGRTRESADGLSRKPQTEEEQRRLRESAERFQRTKAVHAEGAKEEK